MGAVEAMSSNVAAVVGFVFFGLCGAIFATMGTVYGVQRIVDDGAYWPLCLVLASIAFVVGLGFLCYSDCCVDPKKGDDKDMDEWTSEFDETC